jgi:hypothetical protein
MNFWAMTRRGRDSPFHYAQIISLITLSLFTALCSNLVAGRVTPADRSFSLPQFRALPVASGLLIRKVPGEHVTGPGRATGFQMTDFVILENGGSRKEGPTKSLATQAKAEHTAWKRDEKPGASRTIHL